LMRCQKGLVAEESFHCCMKACFPFAPPRAVSISGDRMSPTNFRSRFLIASSSRLRKMQKDLSLVPSSLRTHLVEFFFSDDCAGRSRKLIERTIRHATSQHRLRIFLIGHLVLINCTVKNRLFLPDKHLLPLAVPEQNRGLWALAGLNADHLPFVGAYLQKRQ